MKLNEDVILKIYNEFLNYDIETKSNLRHACPFIYRNYYDPRCIEINNGILKLYFKYLLSKPEQFKNDIFLNSNHFENFQGTFHSFQNLRIRNISSSCIEYFFEVILKKFKNNLNLLKELYCYYQNIESNEVNNIYNSNTKTILLPRSVSLLKNSKINIGEPLCFNTQCKCNYNFINDKGNNEEEDEEGEEYNDEYNNEYNVEVNNNDNNCIHFNIKKKMNNIPFRLLYNNNDSEKDIIQPILKFAMEQGFQRNLNLSYDDFTYQQRMALEGLFEAFYIILQKKICYHLNIKSNFIHLHKFELYNCQFNHSIYIPWSPHLTTIKIIDSRIKLIIDGSQCPRLKYLTVDEEASLKFVGTMSNAFENLETLQLRNINFYETQQLPLFNNLKYLRINNYPSLNITIPIMNDLQKLFIQDNQLCENIYIKPQPNLKFLRLWNFHSCLNLVNEDIKFIYSNYNTIINRNNTMSFMDTHRLSTSSTDSNYSIQSISSSSYSGSTSFSIYSEIDSLIDYPSYFPNVEYLRIGYCSDLLFIKQISQRISTVTVKSSNSMASYDGMNHENHQEKKRLRRFNLIFPNLKTLVIERSYDLVDYLKWFVPTLSSLTKLIFKDCHWGGGMPIDLDNIDVNNSNSNSRSNFNSNGVDRSNILSHQNSNNDLKEKIEEEEEEQEQIEQILLRSNNLQAILQKMRFPFNLSEIIFINCSEDLTKFIQTIIKSRHLSIKFTNIQFNNDYQLKEWWDMF